MSRNSPRIAAVLPLEMEYSSRLLAGAIEYAKQHRRVALVDIPFPVAAPRDLKLPQPYPFDAALVWATREAVWVKDLRAAGIPVVSASSDWLEERIPCVSFDPVAAMRAAIDHLVLLRPKSLAYLVFQLIGNPLGESRSRLFRELAARRGILATSAGIFRPGEEDHARSGYRIPLGPGPQRRLARLLRALPKPAGVWCADDLIGARVVEAAGLLGLRVPDDVAVLGFGDFRVAEICSPQLSSIPLPGEMIGFRAFSMLDALLSGKSGFPDSIPVPPPPVVVRESTSGKTRADPLQRAFEFIERHACEGITVNEVAASLAVSPQALHARFVAARGHPPGEAIRQARVAAAKRWLADPRLSIARVAQLSGYGDQSKFSKFFRRGTGMSPRDWRQAQR